MKAHVHSQTHLQFAPANAKAKNCKRVCQSANSFLPTRKSKIRLVLKNVMMEMNKAQQVTMYIKNKRDSSSIKVCSTFHLSCKLKDLCFEIAYFSYT